MIQQYGVQIDPDQNQWFSFRAMKVLKISIKQQKYVTFYANFDTKKHNIKSKQASVNVEYILSWPLASTTKRSVIATKAPCIRVKTFALSRTSTATRNVLYCSQLQNAQFGMPFIISLFAQ